MLILASVPEIEEVIIFGSRARGDYSRASDVDLSIKGKDFNRHTLARLNDMLYESLKSSIPISMLKSQTRNSKRTWITKVNSCIVQLPVSSVYYLYKIKTAFQSEGGHFRYRISISPQRSFHPAANGHDRSSLPRKAGNGYPEICYGRIRDQRPSRSWCLPIHGQS